MILRPLFYREYGGMRGNFPGRRYAPMSHDLFEKADETGCLNNELRRRLKMPLKKEICFSPYRTADFYDFPGCARFPTDSDQMVLAVCSEDGWVSMFSTKEGEELEHLECWRAHDNSCFDLTWFAGNTKLATGSADRTIKIWDVETSTLRENLLVHLGSVRSVRPFNENPHMLVSSCRGGQVNVWDLRAPFRCRERDLSGLAPQIHYSHPHAVKIPGPMKYRIQSVTGAMPTHDDRLIVTSGSNDGLVKFWDLRGGSKKEALNTLERPAAYSNIKPGIVHMDFDPKGSKLLVSYHSSAIVVYDWVHYTMKTSGGEKSNHFRVLSGTDDLEYTCPSFFNRSCFSPDGQYVCGGSGNGWIFVWDIYDNGEHRIPMNDSGLKRKRENPDAEVLYVNSPFYGTRRHTQEVCGTHWSSNNQIISTGDDRFLCLWQAQFEERIFRPSISMADIDNNIWSQEPRGLALWEPRATMKPKRLQPLGEDGASCEEEPDEDDLDQDEKGETIASENPFPPKKRQKQTSLLDYFQSQHQQQNAK